MRRLATILLLALVVTPLASAAPKAPAFGLRALGNPKLGYFVYSLSPGAVHQGGVIISNSGTATGTVKLFAADATTGSTTGTVYLTDRKAQHAGAWISLAKSTLTLKPGQHRTVPFTVRVPANAKPGQWVGGVVAETSHQVSQPKSKNKASVRIKIRDLTIVAVQVNVPGPPVLGFTIGGVTTGGQRGFQQIVTHIASTAMPISAQGGCDELLEPAVVGGGACGAAEVKTCFTSCFEIENDRCAVTTRAAAPATPGIARRTFAE
jgi:hypothetical protein